MKNLTLHNLGDDGISYLEAKGLAKVFNAYAEYAHGEAIFAEGIGFNAHTAYVYLTLENQITIASCLNQDVEYVTQNEQDEDVFHATYKEALSSFS